MPRVLSHVILRENFKVCSRRQRSLVTASEAWRSHGGPRIHVGELGTQGAEVVRVGLFVLQVPKSCLSWKDRESDLFTEIRFLGSERIAVDSAGCMVVHLLGR